MYDPRKENRFNMKPTADREADIAKVLKFVELAIRKNATIVQITDPSRSGKPDGQFELYSDAGIDSKTFHATLNLKGGKRDAKKR